MPIHIMYLTCTGHALLKVWHNWREFDLGDVADCSDCVWIVPGTLDPSI